MKMIIKNLLSQRKRNIWLFLEMIIVSIVTWIVLDPVMVLLNVESWSHGYDQDRLVYMEFGKIKSNSVRYSEEAADSTEMTKAFDAIVNHIKGMDNVASVTPINAGLHLDGPWSSGGVMNYVDENGDTLSLQSFYYMRPAGRDYFTTYGIKPLPGSPSAEELSNMPMTAYDVIITESVAREMFGEDGDYVGRMTVDDLDGNGNGWHIVGVVEDVRPWQSKGVCRLRWHSEDFNINNDPENTALAVRLKDGVSPDSWLKKYAETVRRGSYIGNLYIKYIVTYSDAASTTWQDRNATAEKRLKITLLAFFLINLALGVIGTFYLQTRQRSHDAGIMKSFGATKRNIYTMLFGESLVITFIGWIIGCVAYMNYAIKEGLSCGNDWSMDYFPTHCWITGFWEHFGIVSIAVLILLSLIVTVGVAIPARRISRVNPVDAIRND